MSGFVYIWRDSEKGMYYVGSHWGSENDGYVCGSSWMKNAYEKRPESFRRRIIARVGSSIKELQKEEQRWLNMISPEEVGEKYYNLKRFAAGGHGGANRGVKRSPEIIALVASKITGSKRTPEQRARISASKKGKPFTEEHKAALRKPSLAKRVPKPKVECPHCGLIGGNGAMHRYHFDNCKVLRLIKGEK